ncbi:MAG: hypothetical protein WC379_13555 [Methanoregula sp.]
MMRKFCVVLLLCILFTGSSGCASSSSVKPVIQPPVFSNGSLVTDGPWISMNPAGDHKKSETYTITGSTSLPAKSTIEVIITESGPSAAKIRTMNDCITEKQKCVVYFARATGDNTGVNRWNVTTDDSMDLFTKGSQERFTVIIKDSAGDLSARSEFRLS